MDLRDNEELVRRFIGEVFVEGRIESVGELVAEDFVSHTFGPSGFGKGDLKDAAARMAGALADVEFQIDDVIAQHDRVAVRLTASATQVGELMGLPPSGRRYTIGEIHIFRIAAGRIAEHWHQHDRAGMLRQLAPDG
jgi:steroid delta-isomerase-like uncharacterized protein